MFLIITFFDDEVLSLRLSFTFDGNNLVSADPAVLFIYIILNFAPALLTQDASLLRMK